MINEKNQFLTVSWLSGLLSAEIFISTCEWGVQMPEAYSNMLRLIPAKGDGPAFVLPVKETLVPVTYQVLQKFVKKCYAKLRLEPGLFGSHSLQRAGASWAFRSQVPGELIQTHGDWSSQANLRYLGFSLTGRCELAQKKSPEICKEGL